MTEPIIATRIWRVHRGLKELKSLYSERLWKPGVVLESQFDKTGGLDHSCTIHHVNGLMVRGHKECLIGIYAYKDYSSLHRRTSSGLTGQGDVMGTVALWGKVDEFEDGYKAQYAYPLSLELFMCSTCGDGVKSIHVTDTWGKICTPCKPRYPNLSYIRSPRLDQKWLREIQDKYLL